MAFYTATEGSSQVEKLLHPRSSNPYGFAWEQWAIEWWKWIFSIPKKNSPLLDSTGENGSINQSGPVWFLAGTSGGSAERSCTIPAGKSVMFPIINVECNSIKDRTDGEGLIKCASSDVDTIKTFGASINGTKIPRPERYRVCTPVFSVLLPAGNIIGVEPGQMQVVSDGYYLLLRPMQTGIHSVQFGGSCLAGTIRVSSTWQLNIE